MSRLLAIGWIGAVACSGTSPNPQPAVAARPPPVAAVDAAEPSQDERLAAIQKAMNELDEAAQGCWAAVAAERFDVEGEIAATIEIRGAGNAEVTIVRDTAHHPKLAACVGRLLANYPWAPPLHGQAIQLPFRFRAPADGQNVIDRVLVPWNVQGTIAIAVLLDDTNTGNAAASMVELAIAAGGSTGARIAERAELWYFLNAATVEVVGTTDRREVAAGDMVYVPANGARNVIAASRGVGSDVHAVVAIVPGGREGAARAGALPTRALGPIKSPVAGPVYLPSAHAKLYPRQLGGGAIFAEPATIADSKLAALILELPANTTIAEHVHAGETEMLYVLAGAGTLTVNGVAITVTRTSVVQIPPNTKHSFAASGDLRALQIYSPAGPEQRFVPGAVAPPVGKAGRVPPHPATPR